MVGKLGLGINGELPGTSGNETQEKDDIPHYEGEKDKSRMEEMTKNRSKLTKTRSKLTKNRSKLNNFILKTLQFRIHNLCTMLKAIPPQGFYCLPSSLNNAFFPPHVTN